MGMIEEYTGDGPLRPGVQYPPRQQTQQQVKSGDEQTFVDLCGSSGDEEEEKGQTLVLGPKMAEFAPTQPPSAVAAAGPSGGVTVASAVSDSGGGGGSASASAAALSVVASGGKGSECLDGGGGNVQGPREIRGAGLFAAQKLCPVAEVVVKRAHDALLTTNGCVSRQAPVEGYGGGTVGEGERGIGSASSARHNHARSRSN